ncbi:MAG: flippase-like domain-containing protein [Gemmatimonadales bacterium]|nr:flippase-like domain-containing protein [Gemmatimonadales bacterium]
MPIPEAARTGRTRRQRLAALLGIALSFGLLYWALRGVHLGEIARHIREAQPLPMAAAVFVATLTFPLRLLRWRLLLRAEDGGPLPRAPLWHAIAIGFMANNVLPFRAGELVRTFTATRLSGARFSSVISSIAVERIFDGLTVVGLLAVALLASDLPDGVTVGKVSVARVAQVTGAMAVAALVGAILVVAFPVAAERLVRRVLPSGRLTDRVVALIEGVRHGLAVLRSPARLAGVMGWSLVLWLTNAWAFHIGFQAFSIPVDFAGALLLQGILIFGISVQLTPGFVGQFEAAIVAALALYGISNDLASSYAIAFHGLTFIPIVLLGAWSLARTPIALSDLRRPQK